MLKLLATNGDVVGKTAEFSHDKGYNYIIDLYL